jgi:hypothetical protein
MSIDAPLVVLAGVVWTCAIFYMFYALKIYRKRRNWINFLILRNSIGMVVCQAINFFGMCLNLFDSVLALKICGTLSLPGSAFQLFLSLYRFHIFGAQLPLWIDRSLKVRIIAPAVVSVCILCSLPLMIYFWGNDKLSRSKVLFNVAIATFFIWFFLWAVVDNVISIWSLKLIVGIKKGLGMNELTKDQTKFQRICIAALTIMILSDFISFPELFSTLPLALESQSLKSPELVRHLSAATSWILLHLIISYGYMYAIFKLISSNRTLNLPLDQEVVSGNMQTSGTKTIESVPISTSNR